MVALVSLDLVVFRPSSGIVASSVSHSTSSQHPTSHAFTFLTRILDFLSLHDHLLIRLEQFKPKTPLHYRLTSDPPISLTRRARSKVTILSTPFMPYAPLLALTLSPAIMDHTHQRGRFTITPHPRRSSFCIATANGTLCALCFGCSY